MEIDGIIELASKQQDHAALACSDDELADGIAKCENAMRLLLATQLQWIAEARQRNLAAQHGARNTKSWLQHLLRISGSEASARVTVAPEIAVRADHDGAPVPPERAATAEALGEGTIGLDHTQAIVYGIRKLPPGISWAERKTAEIMLAENARVLGPEEIRTLAERLRYHYDHDGALRGEENQIEARELHLGVAHDGMTVLKGRLDQETGAKLRAALEPLAAPRPEQDGEKDHRTPGKRNADALAGLLDITLSTDRLPRSGGQRPHLAITIDFDSLRRRIPSETRSASGTVDATGQPITAANVRRIACDAEVLPIVLGGQGEPLDVGRSERTAPPHIRAALLTRDGTCAFPGCDQPPGTPEAHHIKSWLDGGETSLQNMVMLCGAHHRIVHHQQWDIDLSPGRPTFIPPSTMDPSRRARPGNQPLRQRDLAPLIVA